MPTLLRFLFYRVGFFLFVDFHDFGICAAMGSVLLLCWELYGIGLTWTTERLEQRADFAGIVTNRGAKFFWFDQKWPLNEPLLTPNYPFVT